MGIYDREYYRDDGDRWGGWASRGATPWLVGITVAAWVVQLATRDARGGGLTAWAWYDYDRVVGGEVWRLLTPIFLHFENGLLQVICNMLVLFFVGRALEERYGAREFVAFYLGCGLLSHLAYLAAQVAGLAPTGMAGIVFGSTPAVDAAFVVYAFLYPRNKVLLFFVLPVPVWGVAVGFVLFNTLGVMGGVGFAFVALAGALFGALYYLGGIRLTGVFGTGASGSWARSRRQPRLRVVPPDEPDDSGDTDEPPPAPSPAEDRMEDRVDRLLEKVSRYGQESLTPEERELLFRAGEQYKKRRR